MLPLTSFQIDGQKLLPMINEIAGCGSAEASPWPPKNHRAEKDEAGMTTRIPVNRLTTARNWLPRLPVTLAISTLCLLIFAIPGLASLLEFDAQQVVSGQWWRVITGHWTHYSMSHLFWDLSVFGVLGALCESRNRLATWVTLLLSSILIPPAAVSMLQLDVYRGLSGLDTALFALLATSWLVDSVRRRAWAGSSLFALLIAGMLGKVAWEAATGDCLFVDPHASQFTPVPLAHLIGGLVGMLTGSLASPERASRTLRVRPQPGVRPALNLGSKEACNPTRERGLRRVVNPKTKR